MRVQVKPEAGCWPQEDSSPQGSLGPAPHVTLMREYHAVLAELEVWREKKAQRLLQYERLQACPCFPPAICFPWKTDLHLYLKSPLGKAHFLLHWVCVYSLQTTAG